MSILRDFEKRLEGAVEGFFARAFRSGLQPVELAKAVQRYGGSYQQVDLDGVVVPNVYRFTLAPGDLERFSGFARALQKELADVARRTADAKGWRTLGPIRIEFERDQAIRVGTYELRGKIESPGTPAAGATVERIPRSAPPAAAAAAPPPQGPREARAPAGAQASGNGAATLVGLDGVEHGRTFALVRHAVVGRLPECEVVLTDASVSRRHARIQLEGDRWTVTDLGSTNGVRVNGKDVRAGEVRHGDQVEFGGVLLQFETGAHAAGPGP